MSMPTLCSVMFAIQVACTAPSSACLHVCPRCLLHVFKVAWQRSMRQSWRVVAALGFSRQLLVAQKTEACSMMKHSVQLFAL